jgi:methionyl-tRNA formyltransferase
MTRIESGTVIFAHGQPGRSVVALMRERYPTDLGGVLAWDQEDFEWSQSQVASLGVPVMEVRDADVASLIRAIPSPSLGVLAWWPRLLTARELSMFPSGVMNVHPSLLPYNRGRGYGFWAIVEEAPFGITAHWADERVDAGPIILQERIPYDWTDTAGSLYTKAQDAYLGVFEDAYSLARSGRAYSSPQGEEEATTHFASELSSPPQIVLDETTTPRVLLNLIRAKMFPGKAPCWFSDNGEVFEVRVIITRPDIDARDQGATGA